MCNVVTVVINLANNYIKIMLCLFNSLPTIDALMCQNGCLKVVSKQSGNKALILSTKFIIK